MSGLEVRRLTRALLNEWKALGWTDADGIALAIAEALAEGQSPEMAGRASSLSFRHRNSASVSEVTEAIRRVLLDPGTRSAFSERAAESQLRASVVILTAIQSEFRAVQDLLPDCEMSASAHGTRFALTELAAESVHWTVRLAQLGPGNLGSAVETARAIGDFEADLVLFVGVAGAIRSELEIGSVVIADKVYYYESGKADAGGWKPRPLSFRTTHRLSQLAMEVARDTKGVFIKPIAAGEALVASGQSSIAQIVRNHFEDAVAVDMESAGVYEAAYRLERPALAVRGISDHLDDKAGRTDVATQPLASRNAAEIAMALLRRFDSSAILPLQQ